MARYTGKDGTASIGGTAWVLDGWEYEESAAVKEITAAGDDWTERVLLRKDWMARVTGYTSADTFAGVPTVGGSSAMVLSLAGGVGQISDTGIVMSARVTTPHDDPVRIEAELRSVDPTAGPTIT